MANRQALIDAVKTRAATITIANGYQTNIGSKVKEWQTTALESADLPGLVIQDPLESTIVGEDGENSGLYRRELEIIFDAVLQESAQNAVEARKAIADVIKMIGVDPTWGGLARRTIPRSEEH